MIKLAIFEIKNERKADFCVIVCIADRYGRQVELRNVHSLRLKFLMVRPDRDKLLGAHHLFLDLEPVNGRLTAHANASASLVVDIS